MALMTPIFVLVICLLVALSPVPLAAQEPVPELILVMEEESTVGEEVAIETYLQDFLGNPIPGQAVSFSLDMEFLNVFAAVEIGRAITDEDGKALLAYTLKREGELSITARFNGNDTLAPVEATQSLLVSPGPATYQEETPFRIPGVNIALVVTLLASTWALLMLVMGLLWLVSRAGSADPKTESSP